LICGILAILKGEYRLAVIAFSITGSTAGFLFYNFKPARIFMGDSGSLFLGFSLSYLSIAVQNNLGSSSAILVLLIPISLMVIPIMDTVLVTIKRLAAGRRIDQGGKDHTSHRLVALGLSEKKAVLILYFISSIWGVLCILMFKTQVNNLLLCILLLTIGSVIFSIILSKIKVYNESEEKLSYARFNGESLKGNNSTVRFFLLHKKLIIGVCTDILIMFGSFSIDSKAMKIPMEKDYVVLATFICVKISVLYLSNFYYRIWRYVEIIEIMGYFVVTVIATVLLAAILFLKGKTGIYSAYFFVFDFLLTFTGIIISRFFYRWLNELISRNRSIEKKAIIYGAGESGCFLMKELLQNQKHALKPVGWIDDDKSKHNMFLCGYKIYGGQDQLLDICSKIKPDMILISTTEIDKSIEDAIRAKLANQNIGVGRFGLTFLYS
jgi:UDP-GlcNAc:undecaprenyl-phosphate GlcNAc-1-phosphate transferase